MSKKQKKYVEDLGEEKPLIPECLGNILGAVLKEVQAQIPDSTIQKMLDVDLPSVPLFMATKEIITIIEFQRKFMDSRILNELLTEIIPKYQERILKWGEADYE